MSVYTINPLQDSRWTTFLEAQPASSVFHTTQWLCALQQTYGYKPVVYTTASAGQALRDAMVFCWVDSWLTGRRLVSLPFSDHCDPLISDSRTVGSILGWLQEQASRMNYRYFELRPLQELTGAAGRLQESETFCIHFLDLQPDLDTLFHNFHKSSTQRKIQRAERDGLTYQEGNSEILQQHFYQLLLFARRRHGMPPQPRKWFINLARSLGESFKIRVAYSGVQPIAAMITLRHKDTMVYKYGCSDAKFHNLGGVQFLFWKAITEAKNSGLRTLDLGRSDLDNEGLVLFKDRLGAQRSTLSYHRYYTRPGSSHRTASSGSDWRMRAAHRLFENMPDICLSTFGRIFYKHVA